MTDKEYAADCIEFLRELAERMRQDARWITACDDADKLEEIATSLQVDTQEDTKLLPTMDGTKTQGTFN